MFIERSSKTRFMKLFLLAAAIFAAAVFASLSAARAESVGEKDFMESGEPAVSQTFVSDDAPALRMERGESESTFSTAAETQFEAFDAAENGKILYESFRSRFVDPDGNNDEPAPFRGSDATVSPNGQ